MVISRIARVIKIKIATKTRTGTKPRMETPQEAGKGTHGTAAEAVDVEAPAQYQLGCIQCSSRTSPQRRSSRRHTAKAKHWKVTIVEVEALRTEATGKTLEEEAAVETNTRAMEDRDRDHNTIVADVASWAISPGTAMLI